jgi:hypothetical protein
MTARAASGHAVRAAALAGPVALAFVSGGFYDEARLVALIVVAVLLGLWALAGPGPLPRDRRVLLALGGLAAYCAWVALSAGWAPRTDVARHDLERVLLYLGALTLGATLWRPRAAARCVEPAIALGVLIVVGYGLAGRLLPGVVHLGTGAFSGSRLFQPLTYWNAEGELAAMGFILCARLAGDRTRHGGVRMLAAAAAVPIGVALYLTFSRGAIVTLFGGLVVLLALAPTWSQLRAVALTLETAALAVAVCAALPGVNELTGSTHDRETDGAVALAALVVLMLVAAAIATWCRRAEDQQRTRLGRLPIPARSPRIAAAIAVALIIVPIAAAGTDGGGTATPRFGQTTARLASTGSNRYEYWKVAVRVFADAPLKGVGSGGFGTEWLKRRTIDETVRDAHSLYLETLAELGIVGLLALLLAIGGLAAAARAVYRADPNVAAGPIAALTAFGLHAGIDWDWELPALSLVAVALAGLLLSRVPGRSAG